MITHNTIGRPLQLLLPYLYSSVAYAQLSECNLWLMLHLRTLHEDYEVTYIIVHIPLPL